MASYPNLNLGTPASSAFSPTTNYPMWDSGGAASSPTTNGFLPYVDTSPSPPAPIDANVLQSGISTSDLPLTRWAQIKMYALANMRTRINTYYDAIKTNYGYSGHGTCTPADTSGCNSGTWSSANAYAWRNSKQREAILDLIRRYNVFTEDTQSGYLDDTHDTEIYHVGPTAGDPYILNEVDLRVFYKNYYEFTTGTRDFSSSGDLLAALEELIPLEMRNVDPLEDYDTLAKRQQRVTDLMYNYAAYTRDPYSRDRNSNCPVSGTPECMVADTGGATATWNYYSYYYEGIQQDLEDAYENAITDVYDSGNEEYYSYSTDISDPSTSTDHIQWVPLEGVAAATCTPSDPSFDQTQCTPVPKEGVISNYPVLGYPRRSSPAYSYTPGSLPEYQQAFFDRKVMPHWYLNHLFKSMPIALAFAQFLAIREVFRKQEIQDITNQINLLQGKLSALTAVQNTRGSEKHIVEGGGNHYPSSTVDSDDRDKVDDDYIYAPNSKLTQLFLTGTEGGLEDLANLKRVFSDDPPSSVSCVTYASDWQKRFVDPSKKVSSAYLYVEDDDTYTDADGDTQTLHVNWCEKSFTVPDIINTGNGGVQIVGKKTFRMEMGAAGYRYIDGDGYASAGDPSTAGGGSTMNPIGTSTSDKCDYYALGTGDQSCWLKHATESPAITAHGPCGMCDSTELQAGGRGYTDTPCGTYTEGSDTYDLCCECDTTSPICTAPGDPPGCCVKVTVEDHCTCPVGGSCCTDQLGEQGTSNQCMVAPAYYKNADLSNMYDAIKYVNQDINTYVQMLQSAVQQYSNDVNALDTAATSIQRRQQDVLSAIVNNIRG